MHSLHAQLSGEVCSIRFCERRRKGEETQQFVFFFSLIDRSKEGFKNLKRRGKKFKIQKSIFCGVKKN
jgi:hypothetical protein